MDSWKNSDAEEIYHWGYDLSYHVKEEKKLQTSGHYQFCNSSLRSPLRYLTMWWMRHIESSVNEPESHLECHDELKGKNLANSFPQWLLQLPNQPYQVSRAVGHMEARNYLLFPLQLVLFSLEFHLSSSKILQTKAAKNEICRFILTRFWANNWKAKCRRYWYLGGIQRDINGCTTVIRFRWKRLEIWVACRRNICIILPTL